MLRPPSPVGNGGAESNSSHYACYVNNHCVQQSLHINLNDSQLGCKFNKNLSGVRLIQEWTKGSMRQKPFCLVDNIDWILSTAPEPPLKKVFTKLKWTRKHRNAYTVEKEDLEDITQVINENELQETGPVRILVQGVCTSAFPRNGEGTGFTGVCLFTSGGTSSNPLRGGGGYINLWIWGNPISGQVYPSSLQ